MQKDVWLVTHCKENAALVAILMTDHSLFYICAATVITSVGSHGVDGHEGSGCSLYAHLASGKVIPKGQSTMSTKQCKYTM